MRRPGGRETWHRLLEWDRGQADSERLVARLLEYEGYCAVDPSHPLGGPDGGKDAVCRKNDELWQVAAYFPRGKKDYSEIKSKFQEDIGKVDGQLIHGFVFATNQELTLGQREELRGVASELTVDLFHLERIAVLLDSPMAYGLRLEYLAIEMTREEQVAFINERDEILRQLRDLFAEQRERNRAANTVKSVTIQQPDALNELGGVFGGKLVSCVNCREVFRAWRGPSVVHFSDSLETVTCPNCGKIQGL